MARSETKRSRKIKDTFSLLSCPNETIAYILSFLDFKTLVNAFRSCKRMGSFGGKESILWTNLSKNLALPSAEDIGFTDHAILRAIYGRGCDGCNEHPRTRKPIWEFGGRRLCKKCLRSATIRHYECPATIIAIFLVSTFRSSRWRYILRSIPIAKHTKCFCARITTNSSKRSYRMD